MSDSKCLRRTQIRWARHQEALQYCNSWEAQTQWTSLCWSAYEQGDRTRHAWKLRWHCVYPKSLWAMVRTMGVKQANFPRYAHLSYYLLNTCRQLTTYDLEFQYKPQSRNRQIINLREKWGFRRFQKERLKIRKAVLFAHFLRTKCGFAHFHVLFLESAETPLLRRLIIWRFRLCGSYWNS